MQEVFTIIPTGILNFLKEAFFMLRFDIEYFKIFDAPKAIDFEYYYFY